MQDKSKSQSNENPNATWIGDERKSYKFIHLMDMVAIFGNQDVEVMMPFRWASDDSLLPTFPSESHNIESDEGVPVYYKGRYDGKTHSIQLFDYPYGSEVTDEWTRCIVDSDKFPEDIVWDRIIVQRPGCYPEVNDIPRKVLNNLDWLQHMVGGLIETANVGPMFKQPMILAVVNEEGKITSGFKPSFTVLDEDDRVIDVLMGTVLFVKPDYETGEFIGLDDEERYAIINYLM